MADETHVNEMALSLINAQSTMALATARDDCAWAAPVYFVFHKTAFYFFSSPDSRHICEALDSGQASATIYPVVDTWQDIRGIQMAGKIRPAGKGLKALQALHAYTVKFPFVKSFFKPGQALNLDAFAKRFRVRFYCYKPDLIYYLDNQIEFGFRKAVTLA